MKSVHSVAVMGLTMLSLALAACAPALAEAPTPTAEPTAGPVAPTTEPTPPPIPGGEIGGVTELVEALRAMGMEVELGHPIDEPLFSGEGRFITVSGVVVQVFEYKSDAARQAESSQVTSYGSPSPSVIVEWIAPPHFWTKGRLIVLYVGSDEALADQLTSVLGEPVAVGSGGFLPVPTGAVEAAAIAFLAGEVGLTTEQISAARVESVDWPDACLGLPREGEACAEVITFGYKVMLSAQGQEYELHTNADGSAVRLK